MVAAMELISYYAAMVTSRRGAAALAGDHPDLTYELAHAEMDGDRLTDGEIIAFLFLMVVAGNETTTKLLGNALFHLAANPGAAAEVVADPELVVPWIEETLRHDTSSQMIARYVAQGFSLHGETVPEGAKVLLLLGSANRDEEVFERPDTFDLHREDDEFARILSFGNGRHFCLGAHLARLEARVVLRSLMERISDFTVRAEAAVRVHSTSVRGFASLPVTFVPSGTGTA